MRITSTILAWSLCSIAAAQSPDQLVPAKDAAVIPPSQGTAILKPSTLTADTMTASATATATASATALQAGTLYMCTFENDSPLYTLSSTNGKATRIGSMGINESCTDLAIRQTTASGTQLFGTSFTHLFSINPTTGKATLLPDAYGTDISDINALVAQPGSGVLYGAGSTAPGEFIEISPTTGKATKKGKLGTGISSAGDLEFLNGQLYGLVNKSSTGTETYLAKISLSSKTLGNATDLVPIRRKEGNDLVVLDNVWGLANRGGVLYAAMEDGNLLTIVPSTGIATLKGDNNLAQAGLAVVP